MQYLHIILCATLPLLGLCGVFQFDASRGSCAAAWEMRSKPDADGHGHQATYDNAGSLITSTIAAGTADKVSPGSWYDKRTANHRNIDVIPYIMALQLDGNPVWADNLTGLIRNIVPSRLDRPCIYVGTETEEYLRLRPTPPTGVQY